jgi:hypothetical protein
MTTETRASQTGSDGLAQPKVELPVVRPIHIQAEELLQKMVDDFENDLRLQANTLAKNDELVLSSHIRDAFTILRNRNTQKWTEELPVLVGGSLFGAFLSCFSTELSMLALRPLWISIYVGLGFLGMLLVFYGLMQRYGR